MRKLKQVFSFSCFCQPTTACRKNSGHLQPRGNRDEEIGFGVRPPRAFGRFETGSKFRRNGNDFFSALAKVFFLKKNLFLSDCFCSEATKILFQNDFLALQLREKREWLQLSLNMARGSQVSAEGPAEDAEGRREWYRPQ